MSVWKANLQKEWRIHRSLLVDYLCVALALLVLVPAEGKVLFGILGCVLGASLGARIGGDEVMNRSWEFVLTRPVARGEWLRTRFLLGLLPLGALLVLFLFCDLVNLPEACSALLADPLPGTAPAAFAPWSYLQPLVIAGFVYTLTFGMASGETRPENVLNHRVTGFLIGLLLVGIIQVAMAFVLHNLGFPSSPNSVFGQSAYCAAFVAIGALYYRGTHRRLRMLEVTEQGVLKARGGAGLTLVLVVILLLLLMGALVTYISLAPSPVPYEVK